MISESIASKSRIEYEDRIGEKAEVCLMQEENGSGTILGEVQLVIGPPVDAVQLAKFIGRVEEMLESSMLRMVGSWDGGTAITIPLTKPTPLSNILSEFEEMPEVETMREKPLTGERGLGLLKKAATIPRPKAGRNSRIIFVTLKNN